jgi:ribonuclease Z
MRPLIHPRLINDPFGDPGLFLAFKFQRRAMLFDLGDLTPLSPRELLRVSEAFVSHCHMDHFSGFDRLLRTCVGRDKTLRLFGPPGFIDKVEHKLRSYDWNVVHLNPLILSIEVAELAPDETLTLAAFRSSEKFRRADIGARPAKGGLLFDDGGYQVRAAILEHGIPCLAFRIDEPVHVEVWRNRLTEMGLGVGPWLKEAKRAVVRGAPDATEIDAVWRDGETWREKRCTLGEVRSQAMSLASGQSIAYVVDCVFNDSNADKIIKLARGADVLFIEAAFLDEDKERAADRHHLTAGQAGELAGRAGAKRLVPFHFSPRHLGEEDRIRRQARDAFEAARKQASDCPPLQTDAAN